MSTQLVSPLPETPVNGRLASRIDGLARRPRPAGELPVHHLYDEPFSEIPHPFVITSFGELGAFSAAEFPHRHDFYELLFITAGIGRQVIDFVPYQVESGSIYLIRPGQVQYWEQAAGLEGQLILFKEEFLPDFYGYRPNGASHRDVLAPTSGSECRPGTCDLERVGDLIAALDREYHRPAGTDRSVLQAYLHILMVELWRMRRIGPPDALDRSGELAREFVALVRERIPHEQTVAGYASAIGVTPKHLAEVVREVTGSSPAEIIRGSLTIEAKRLLAHTELTIAQIADALAFDNPSYFGRFFKRESGMRPGEFRAASIAGQQIQPA